VAPLVKMLGGHPRAGTTVFLVRLAPAARSQRRSW
jgi:hypothetical protein